MNKFALILIISFLVGCGGKSSPTPPSVLIQTKVVQIKVPENLLQQHREPREPKANNVAGLKTMIEQLRALNKRHNQDKADITRLQEDCNVQNTEAGK